MSPAEWIRNLAILISAGLLSACGDTSESKSSAQQPAGIELAAATKQAAAKSPSVPALSYNAQKAHFDYQMNCQGCHGPAGAGNIKRDVPSLDGDEALLGQLQGDDVDRFLRLPEGREFLIRVPGMSRSPLSDADLANLANWMMQEFGGSDGTLPFEPFDEVEVAQLRNNPIVDGVVEHRAKLVARLDAIPKS